MAKKKPASKCPYTGCKRQKVDGGRFCRSHYNKVTIQGFLSQKYVNMKRRVTSGGNTRRPDLYRGLAILPKDVFFSWATNHPDFLSIYKRWVTSNFDRKLTPSVNRMNSSKGYTLDNMEWMTNSQNCGLSAGVRSMKQKKAIYELLGVKQ